MNRKLIIAVALLLFGAPFAIAAPAPELTAHCQSCHGGTAGNKTAAPNLNGLSADYLVARLNAFANPVTQSPHAIDNMWSVVVGMNPDAKRELADYFAQQPAPQAKLSGPALGKNLYERGLPEQNVAPCQSCHGARAEGQGAIPRLAGQRSEYLKMQLWAFNLTARIHGSMNAGAMKYTSDDIDALASFLAGQ